MGEESGQEEGGEGWGIAEGSSHLGVIEGVAERVRDRDISSIPLEAHPAHSVADVRREGGEKEERKEGRRWRGKVQEDERRGRGQVRRGG